MKTEEEEEDQESVGSSPVSPSGTKTGARLPVFHHQHAGSERVLHINSSVCACACKSVCVCVCKERARKGPDCLQGPPRRWAGAQERLAEKGEECVHECLCVRLCVLGGENVLYVWSSPVAHQCQGWKGCGMNESRESKRDYTSDHVSSSIYWTQPLWRWGPLIKSGIVRRLKERVGSTPWLICPPALFYSIFPRLYVFDIFATLSNFELNGQF